MDTNNICKVNNFQFSKTNFEILLLIWDYIIIEGDELLIHFMIVAFLIYKKDVNY